ncbi:type II toxin-antitoxin system VapC family toxin [Belnapia moabensis]|uniref:type II toxin-antitoxin system VapC family toxin n=1 Tax=Belnapia moabensis TaxID=365533 RepID=UPI0005BA0B99|nr:type II toxin-antitoxin system VapC family toxin [Belnapia moabensis]
MIVDTSALMAILRDEPDAALYGAALTTATTVAISAATLVEATMVAEGRTGQPMEDRLGRLLGQAKAEVVSFTAEHAALAADGWRRFGKGRHPAGLNLGDCFAYALARHRNEPLLFKGDDFARTDVKAAL